MVEGNRFSAEELLSIGGELMKIRPFVTEEQFRNLNRAVLEMNRDNLVAVPGRNSFRICEIAVYTEPKEELKFRIHSGAVDRLQRLYGKSGGVAIIHRLINNIKGNDS